MAEAAAASGGFRFDVSASIEGFKASLAQMNQEFRKNAADMQRQAAPIAASFAGIAATMRATMVAIADEVNQAAAGNSAALSNRVSSSFDAIKKTGMSMLQALAGKFGVVGKVVAMLLPSIEGLLDSIMQGLAGLLHSVVFQKFAAYWETLANFVAATAAKLEEVWTRVTNAMNRTWSAVTNAWSSSTSVLGGLGDAIKAGVTAPMEASAFALKDSQKEFTAWAGAARKSVENVKSALEKEIRKAAGMSVEEPAKPAEPEAEAAKGGRDVFGDLLKNLELRTIALGKEAEALGKGAAAQARYKAEMQAMSVLQRAGITLSDEQKAKLEETIKALEAAATSGAGVKWQHEMVQAGERAVQTLEIETATIGRTAAEAERYRFTQQALNAAKERGIDVSASMRQAVEAEAQKLAIAKAKAEETRDTMRQINDASQVFSNSMLSAFRSWTEGAKFSVKEMAANILRELAAIILKANVLKALFGGGGGGDSGLFGNLLGSLLGLPGRAAGGPVASGKPYMVGEAGPEMFVPNSSGSIVPNGAGGGVSVSMPIYLNAAGAYPESIEEIRGALSAMQQSLPSRVVAVVNDARSRGHI